MADPFSAFQMGAGLGAGQSTLGALVKTVVERMSQMQDLQAQVGGQVAVKRATLPLEEASAIRVEQAKAAAQGQADLSMIQSLGKLGGGEGGVLPTEAKVGNVTVSLPGAITQKTNEELARRQGEVHDAVDEGLKAVSTIRQLLAVSPGATQVGTRTPISRSGVPGFALQEATQRQVRTQLGKLFNMIALIRTGRQGLEQQIPFVQEQYNLGFTDPDAVIVDRLNQAEQELLSHRTQSSTHSFRVVGKRPAGTP